MYHVKREHISDWRSRTRASLFYWYRSDFVIVPGPHDEAYSIQWLPSDTVCGCSIIAMSMRGDRFPHRQMTDPRF